MGEYLNKLACTGWTTYPVNENLAFALSDKQIIILTPFCSYILTNDRLNSKAGHERIRRGIQNNQYKSIADVLTDMRLSPGIGVGYRVFNIEELA
jgi:hypothetical protein